MTHRSSLAPRKTPVVVNLTDVERSQIGDSLDGDVFGLGCGAPRLTSLINAPPLLRFVPASSPAKSSGNPQDGDCRCSTSRDATVKWAFEIEGGPEDRPGLLAF